MYLALNRWFLAAVGGRGSREANGGSFLALFLCLSVGADGAAAEANRLTPQVALCYTRLESGDKQFEEET